MLKKNSIQWRNLWNCILADAVNSVWYSERVLRYSWHPYESNKNRHNQQSVPRRGLKINLFEIETMIKSYNGWCGGTNPVSAIKIQPGK